MKAHYRTLPGFKTTSNATFPEWTYHGFGGDGQFYENPPMECLGGPWDGRLATALEARSYRGFASGRYVVVVRPNPETHPWGVTVLEWTS